MAKKESDHTEENIANIQEAIGKTELFIEKNQKKLTYGVIAIFAIVLLILGYNKYVRIPKNQEAYNAIWHAEQYFAKDSFQLALNGVGEKPGFLEIIDTYGSTKSGNLAEYYAGICYCKLAQKATGTAAQDYYKKAIDYLKDFKSDDLNVKQMSLTAIGDCQMELGNSEKAAETYIKSAKFNDNQFLTPMNLKKAGMTYSMLGKHKEAVKLFEEIEKNYFKSEEARDIKKYIAREDTYINK